MWVVRKAGKIVCYHVSVDTAFVYAFVCVITQLLWHDSAIIGQHSVIGGPLTHGKMVKSSQSEAKCIPGPYHMLSYQWKNMMYPTVLEICDLLCESGW